MIGKNVIFFLKIICEYHIVKRRRTSWWGDFKGIAENGFCGCMKSMDFLEEMLNP